MPRLVKQILARYVKAVEIIGYAFVLLFIGGLIALSFIKAEDEFVTLNGQLEVRYAALVAEKTCFIWALIGDTTTAVNAGAALFEVTTDSDFIADQAILQQLQAPAKQAEGMNRNQIAAELDGLIEKMKKRLDPNPHKAILVAGCRGAFFAFKTENAIVFPGECIGGSFDFDSSMIRVTEFPADARQKRKLKTDQSGTATLRIDAGKSISVIAKLIELDEAEAHLKLEALTRADQVRLANYLGAHSASHKSIPVSISLLVGWKSWMQLIWR